MYAQTAPHPLTGLRVSLRARFGALALLRDERVDLRTAATMVDVAADALVTYGEPAARIALAQVVTSTTARAAVDLLLDGMVDA